MKTYDCLSEVRGTRNRATESTTPYDFVVQDRFGRHFGTEVCRFECQVVPTTWVTENGITVSRTDGEPYYAYGVWVHATRDGKLYGSSAPEKYFRTWAEREKWITKYLAGALRRARKASAKDQQRAMGSTSIPR